jgi:hypothetical protein
MIPVEDLSELTLEIARDNGRALTHPWSESEIVKNLHAVCAQLEREGKLERIRDDGGTVIWELRGQCQLSDIQPKN